MRQHQAARNAAEQAGAEETAELQAETAEDLQEENERLADEAGRLRDSILRLRAEFDNFRKRTQKEKDQIRDIAKEGMMADLLPVLDNFGRAIGAAAAANDSASVKQGVEMVYNQLISILESEGLTRIDPLGEQFDPMVHEALAIEERSDVPDHQIVGVIMPGYRLGDRIIRHAMVTVAKKPDETGGGKSAG